jgi:hypothetical protein
MNREEFNQAATEEFGIQAAYLPLGDCNRWLEVASVKYEDLGFVAVGQDVSPAAFAPLTQAEVLDYGLHIWCTECPACGAELRRSFSWGLAHGEGQCRCGKTAFRYYHRPRERMYPIMMFALIGF